MPLENLNAGTLLAHIDRSWDMQRTLRSRIAKHLPALEKRARENLAIVEELVRGQENPHARAGTATQA